MGIDQSLRAAGTAGFGAPLPCDHALVSSTSRQLLAMARARRTRMSLNGSWSSFIQRDAAEHHDVVARLQLGHLLLGDVEVAPPHDQAVLRPEVVARR